MLYRKNNRLIITQKFLKIIFVYTSLLFDDFHSYLVQVPILVLVQDLDLVILVLDV